MCGKPNRYFSQEIEPKELLFKGCTCLERPMEVGIEIKDFAESDLDLYWLQRVIIIMKGTLKAYLLLQTSLKTVLKQKTHRIEIQISQALTQAGLIHLCDTLYQVGCHLIMDP